MTAWVKIHSIDPQGTVETIAIVLWWSSWPCSIGINNIERPFAKTRPPRRAQHTLPSVCFQKLHFSICWWVHVCIACSTQSQVWSCAELDFLAQVDGLPYQLLGRGNLSNRHWVALNYQASFWRPLSCAPSELHTSYWWYPAVMNWRPCDFAMNFVSQHLYKHISPSSVGQAGHIQKGDNGHFLLTSFY